MVQKKTNTNRDNPTRMHLIMQVPIKDRSMCVEPGTFIGTDSDIYMCTEASLPSHCVECDAPREFCKIMRCMPYDRPDRQYVIFKCVHSNNE